MILALLVSLAPAAAAPCEGTLRGRVVAPATSAPVAGATVDGGHGVVRTDADGRFVMRLPCGRAVLLVTLESGAVQASEADVAAGGVELTLEASPARFEEAVEVRAPASDAAPKLTVRPVQVKDAAGAAENVFRLLATLPGVAATDEFTSRLSVRGGGPDQNLTVMDGIEIHDPYRLFGLVSAFNPETVAAYELSAGAFSARHGDRLSSILVVENRAGTEQEDLAGSAALAITDANVLLEGRLPDARGSWLVAGRRTYYDLVAERIVDDDLPSFQDVQAKVVWRPAESVRLSLFGLRSAESADAAFEGDRAGEGGAFVTDAGNEALSIGVQAGTGRLLSRSVLALTRTTEDLDVDAQFRAENRRSNAPVDDDAFALADVDFTRGLSVRDLSARQELAWQARPTLLLEAGAAVHLLQTSVAWDIEGDRNLSEGNGSSVRGGVGLPDRLQSQVDGTRWGAFVMAAWRPSARFTVEPGIRVDRGSLGGDVDVSPRAAFTFLPDDHTRVRAAAGVYRQSPGYEKLVSSDYFVDLSPGAAAGLVSERSTHLLLSVEREMPMGLTARVEVYRKSFDDLVVGRLETEAERAQRLARYDFPAALASSVPVAAQITDQPANGARGSASGVEVYLARQPMDAGARLTGWMSYAWGRAEREAYGRAYPFDYDREHAFSAVGNLRLSDRWDVAFTARAASGFPRTPALGLRVSGAEDLLDADGDGRRDEIVPERDAAGRLVWTVDRGGVENLNAGRLPVYARLDARVTWKPRGALGRWTLYLDLLNVTNRDNAGRIEETLEHAPGADRPRLVEARDAAVPFLPSFGVAFRF